MRSEKLIFEGFPDHDIYNITAPFHWMGRDVIAGRVEKRTEELSQIVLFEKSANGWTPVPNAPVFSGLQDPCVTWINGNLLLGGVRFPVIIGDDQNAWQMEFFIENEGGKFEKVLTGPPKMKDVRFLQLPDHRIFVLTRPQGEKGGRGKIGFCIVDSLADATHDVIDQAPLFDHCAEKLWVGANEAHNLNNGRIGVLGHIAEFDEDQNRHYYAMAFAIDPEEGTSTQPEIIAKRCDFPEGESKREDLEDVIFSGGIQRQENGKALLFAGLSDAEAGFIELPDPFLQYEN